ncbi:MFS transporter [Sporolactobacillus terrae]|nr:MFS transporter [Sporolactobacillus terrae]QAA23785.1 MFS transporter [Sporolactobacillus terrae]QAA26756.1 MFS transporter [Sporolactobacillus terrae]UAK15823.1 MFS transporter [Sporolactobacillus terrae]BBO00327.1 MFS transporter [Sporolactobacillus terrae]
MSLQKVKTVYAISVYVSLAAFDNIVIGLFPPLFSNIAKDLNVAISAMGVVSAVNILATAFSSLFWGYLSGKFHRKRLVIVGTLIWVIGVYLTALSSSYIHLMICQIITGIGLGCVASIGFSALTDYVPYHSRGMVLSLWGMSQGFGGIAGALIASIISSLSNWRLPFEVLAIIGLLLIVFYFFVEEPRFGSMEPELKKLMDRGMNYTYRISLGQIMTMLSKRSNLLLFLQGFFMNIATGSLIWLPTLYIARIKALGYGPEIAMIVAAFLYGIFQVGGTLSSYFGYLGDKLQRRSYKARALLTAVFVFLTMPLYILLFIFPIDQLSLPNTTNSVILFFSLLGDLVTNPWILTLFIISLFASAAQSANTPNWLALITDVNLPEHRGAVFSIANLFNSFGRTVGNLGIGAVLAILSMYLDSPSDYIVTMTILQLPLIPSALCYVIMAKYNVRDIHKVKDTLDKRGKIV